MYTKASRFFLLLKGDYAPPPPPTPRKLNSVKPWFQRLNMQKIKLNYQIRKKIEESIGFAPCQITCRANENWEKELEMISAL